MSKITPLRKSLADRKMASGDGLLLPGDFVDNVTEANRPFLIDNDGMFSTKVAGRLVNGEFKAGKCAIVPRIHDIVIGRVIRVRMKEAHVLLLTANGKGLGAPLRGELRAVDVRDKDVDSVIVSQFCKPGDLIQARVVALGRSGFYAQLSTAEDGLGVMHLEKSKDD